MPTYEFRCSNGHRFEQFHKISDAPSTAECPECGAVAERAISGGAGLVFKGCVFDLTVYGKNAHRGGAAPAKPSEGGDSGAKSDGGSKSDASSSGGASGGAAGAAPAATPSTSTGDGGSSKGAA